MLQGEKKKKNKKRDKIIKKKKFRTKYNLHKVKNEIAI